jgi:hypothetical protein
MFQRHDPPSSLDWHMPEAPPGMHADSGIIRAIQAKIKSGNVPDSFPEFNSAVIAFRRDAKLADLFRR